MRKEKNTLVISLQNDGEIQSYTSV